MKSEFNEGAGSVRAVALRSYWRDPERVKRVKAIVRESALRDLGGKEIAELAGVTLARKRHAEADSPLFNSAGFAWDGKAYVVTVRDCVVLVTASLQAVKDFSAIHNGRLAEAMA